MEAGSWAWAKELRAFPESNVDNPENGLSVTVGGFCLYRGTKKSWEILDSFPKGYQVIMKYLLQKLISPQTHTDQETGGGTELSALIVWRGRWRAGSREGNTWGFLLG